MMRAASRERMAALGIDVWVRRSRVRARTGVEASQGTPEPAEGAAQGAVRVRLASGEGDWLLVQDAPWDGRHETLLGDIQATIGSARCRFGQWAHSESAGVSIDELGSRGIRHLLAFGTVPDAVDGGQVLLAPALPDLAVSADARRRLWQELTAALGG